MDGPVLWWARRDLRLDDNPALTAALQTGRPVIPVFVWAPEEEGQFQQGRYSRWWTKHSVVLFQRVLEQMGSRLIIRRASETSRGLMQVVNDTGATAVYFNHLYDPISLVRDHEAKNALIKLGIECKSFNADLLYEPWDVLDSNSQPYTNFDAYWGKVLEMPSPPPFPLPAPAQLPVVAADLFSVGVQEVDWFMTPEQEASSEQLKFKWRPGVEGAVDKLEEFLGAQLQQFEHDRAKVDRNSTSMLSPWVHIGTISVRYVFYRVCQRQAELRLLGHDISSSCKDYLQQLGYREYSRYLSFHFPFIHERTLLAHLRACPWRMDQQHFKAWRQGQTGYPLIDAAMRELWSTGWCHNRMRVVASSFMVKNLLLPWQWGLKHFWDAQMDADLECDALGWQYVSGGMSDAHPFSYIIDLEQEAKRFDPDGEYVRRWLPVLSRLPTNFIHAPWAAPPQVLVAADVELGFNYPERIITMEESHLNLAHACKVLESCASTSSGHAAGSYPYRPPTLPPSLTAQPLSGNNSRPSQANGTGTGTCYDNNDAAGAGSGQPAQAPAAAKPAAAAMGKKHGRDGNGMRWPAAYLHRHTVTIEEGASALLPAPGGRAERLRQRAVACDRRRAMHAYCHHEPEGQDEGEGEVVHVGPQQAGDMLEEDDMLSSSSGSLSDAAMSEEVVSNTVGLSAPQATACSGRLAEQDDEWEAASGRPVASRRQVQPLPHHSSAGHAQQAEQEAGPHPPTRQYETQHAAGHDGVDAREQPPPHVQVARGVKPGAVVASRCMAAQRIQQQPYSGSDWGTQTPLVGSLQTGTPSGPSGDVQGTKQGQAQGQAAWLPLIDGTDPVAVKAAGAALAAAAGQAHGQKEGHQGAQQGEAVAVHGVGASRRLVPHKRHHSEEEVAGVLDAQPHQIHQQLHLQQLQAWEDADMPPQ